MSYSGNEAITGWLAQEKPETVIEPELPIIDPHHHLWDIRTFETEPYASFEQKMYLCEDIMDDISSSGHNITQTVFAQCGAFYRADGPEHLRCVGETEFAHGVAAMSRSGIYGDTRLCTGIFSSADLRLGAAVEEVLEAHLAASPYFRGIRTAFPSDLNKEFMAGFNVLAKLGLSFDNWSPDFLRLPNLAKLAERQPDVTIIVNHMGGQVDTNADAAVISEWQSAIDSVAACSNTVLKVGGAQMRIGPWEPSFHMHQRSTPMGSEEMADMLLPFYLYVIEAFGPERCMFESNFPVDKECVSYRTLWNMFKIIADKAGLNEGEKQAMFSGTAARVYKLN